MPVPGAGHAGQRPAAGIRQQVDLAGQTAPGPAQRLPVLVIRPRPLHAPGQLPDDWLATGHEQIGTSLARFIGIDGYGVETLRDDLARFMFLLGETNGEGLFSPRTVELIEPAALPSPDTR